VFEKGGIVSRGNSYLSSETPVSCFLLGTVLYPPHAPVTRTNEHHYDYQSQQQCDLSSRHVNSQALQVSIITLPYHYPPPPLNYLYFTYCTASFRSQPTYLLRTGSCPCPVFATNNQQHSLHLSRSRHTYRYDVPR